MKLLEKIINQETYMVNWDEVAKIPEFGVLKKTEQNPKWHSEGNVSAAKRLCFLQHPVEVDLGTL